ncbi:MAG: hypothetical protein WCV69_04895 [Patescibacteria group bacterium]|jgi:hypothetical protein
MPKIVITGYEPAKAEVLREMIDLVLQRLGLGDEAITDVALNHVARSCDGKGQSMPYIQVCSTDSGEIGDIMKSLVRAGIGEDTEWLLLGGFKSAADMENDPEFGSGV